MPQLLREEDEAHHPGPIDTLHLRAAFAPTYEAWLHDRIPIPTHILAQVRPGAPVTPQPQLQLQLRIAAHHPIIHDLKPVAEAAWVVSFLQGSDRKDKSKFPGIEEYVDVFEDLACVLRCKTCFGDYFFNSGNPATCTRTGTHEQFTWDTIAQTLASDPLSPLPVPPALHRYYYFTTSAIRPVWPQDIIPLIRSVQLGSAALGIEFEAVRRQIVMYAVDLETWDGPKRFLRLGLWGGLLDNASKLLGRVCRRVEREKSLGKKTEVVMALECVAAQVQAVRDKWFVRNGNGKFGWGLSERAVAVGMRLADGGDPREGRERRRVRLFEYGSGRLVPPLAEGEGSACDSEDDDEDEDVSNDEGDDENEHI